MNAIRRPADIARRSAKALAGRPARDAFRRETFAFVSAGAQGVEASFQTPPYCRIAVIQHERPRIEETTGLARAAVGRPYSYIFTIALLKATS